MQSHKLAFVGIVEHAQHVFRDEALPLLSFVGASGYHWTTSFDQLMVWRWMMNKMVMRMNAIAMKMMAIA